MSIARLRDIMRSLRDPATGCPWDKEQTFATIAPYTIEEAYEVAEAIDRNAPDDLKDELGDLLFQVVFHSQMADELGQFDFDDVVDAICSKMERRHPHVFGNIEIADAEAQTVAWEQHKAAERGDEDTSALAGISKGMPEWLRAMKLTKRAARVGFDWPDANAVMDKLAEETQETHHALEQQDPGAVEHEIGDLLFTVINLARKAGVDPGTALRQCNQRFEQRFRAMEAASDRPLKERSLDEMEALWQQAKAKLD